MRRVAAVAALGLVAACAERGGPPTPRRASPGDAYCRATVEGVGVLDVESDYLPHVVACEHGSADPAALRAQAIAARSYLYYELDRRGAIRDGQMHQVYTCGRKPRAAHYAAVRDTAYQVLLHGGRPVAGFYVAGARPLRRTCRGGAHDPTNTERYVTYNGGQRGRRVKHSPIGALDPANRGCMSQNAAQCLAGRGWQEPRILRHFYGGDIDIAAVSPERCGAPARAPEGLDRDRKLAAFALGFAAAVALFARFARKRQPKKRASKR